MTCLFIMMKVYEEDIWEGHNNNSGEQQTVTYSFEVKASNY